MKEQTLTKVLLGFAIGTLLALCVQPAYDFVMSPIRNWQDKKEACKERKAKLLDFAKRNFEEEEFATGSSILIGGWEVVGSKEYYKGMTEWVSKNCK